MSHADTPLGYIIQSGEMVAAVMGLCNLGVGPFDPFILLFAVTPDKAS